MIILVYILDIHFCTLGKKSILFDKISFNYSIRKLIIIDNASILISNKSILIDNKSINNR